MVAFAGNSILNRLALADGTTGPAAFAAVRLVSGALVLVLLTRGKALPWKSAGRWMGASTLAIYVVAFSFAFVVLPAGVGALIMFAGVQTTMFVGAIMSGAKVPVTRYAGAVLAFAGLTYLMWPTGVNTLPLWGTILMLAAGFGSGMYSLLGSKAADALAENAVNFVWASPVAILVLILFPDQISSDGFILACIAGSVTTGLAFSLWYFVLPSIEVSVAALAQLTVPLISFIAGMAFLNEGLTPRFAVACVLVLGGVALGLKPGAARKERATQ